MGGRDFDIFQDYFEWLCNIIHCNQANQSWWILMKDLHHRKFYAIVPHDENRASDGLEMREDYLREMHFPEYMIDFAGECSVFEMLIGLARRIDFELSNPYSNNQTDRTAFWFWEMISNLGLINFDDESYAELGGVKQVDKIINKLLSRKYKRNGEGGLFPLHNSKKDQCNIEIWYQMSAYLTEREAMLFYAGVD